METKVIGNGAGKNLTKATNCFFMGENAGAEITEGDGLIIIGDHVRSLDPSQGNVLIIHNKIAIGETLFGEKINLKEVVQNKLMAWYSGNPQRAEEQAEGDGFIIT